MSEQARNRNESVFDWNNQASLNLQQGDFRKAAAMYVRILARLDQTSVSDRPRRRSVHSVISSNPNVAYVSDDEEEEEDEEEEPSPLLTLLSVHMGVDLGRPRLPVDGAAEPFALYHQTFVTAFREETQVTQDANSRSLVAALVRFNLGITIQVKEGRNPPQEQPHIAMLRGARQSYINALRFLDEYYDEGVTEDALLLGLAIYNNLGHLYHKLGSSEESQRCSTHIQFLLRTRREVQFPMSPNDWNFFAHTSFLREQAQALHGPAPSRIE